MGAPVEKGSRGIMSDMLKCIGDDKKHIGECTLAALDSWVSAVNLDKMVPYIMAAIIETKLSVEGCKDLFDWLSGQLSVLSDYNDAVHLVKPASSAMMDKSFRC